MEKKQIINTYCRQFKMSGMMASLDQALREAETTRINNKDLTPGKDGQFITADDGQGHWLFHLRDN